MSRIDDVAQIIYELTDETVQIDYDYNNYSFGSNDYAIVLSPTFKRQSTIYSEVEGYDLVIHISSNSYDLLESKRTSLLKCSSWHPNGYKPSTRVYFIVDSITGFSVGDTVTSGSKSGVIYKIDGSVMYLKNVIGSFAQSDTIGNGSASATISSTVTTLSFPQHLRFTLIDNQIIEIVGVWHLV